MTASRIRRIRKASAVVTLSVAGSTALVGCEQAPPTAQDLYSSRADCAREWGDQNCQQSGGGGSAGYYRGPPYSASANAAEGVSSARPGSRAFASSVTRGGFGMSSGSHGFGLG